MRHIARTPLIAVFRNEVLLNSQRTAPYALMILFAANALLWWGWGPAVRLGWATNSEFYIVRNLLGFSFLLGLPIFNAVIMGDPVIRDFQVGIDPLVFSKPVNRVEYLLGKFFGNFFVLVCCQAAFPLTLLVLQAFSRSQMIVQPIRLFPYFKHFFFFVVISHLALAAFYFTVGCLTRNAKIVYILAVCFYPVYIAYQVVVLKGLTPRWNTMLDPLLFNSIPAGGGFQDSAELLNQLVVTYTADMMANRVLMLVITGVCLAILCYAFTIAERPVKVAASSILNLAPGMKNGSDVEGLQQQLSDVLQFEQRAPEQEERPPVVVPAVTRSIEGLQANLKTLFAAVGIEVRLLRSERSLVVVVPLVVFLSNLDVTFYPVVPEFSYSATYATSSANALLLFLVGIAVFYTGEAMHRDREVRIEPVLWATPAANSVFLQSKFLRTLLLTASLTILVGLTAVLIQFLRGHTPVESQPYLIIYSVILLPDIVFLAAVSVALNVLLRNKYLSYVVSLGTGAGLYYLYGVGHIHWLYNPLLYQLWNYPALTGGGHDQDRILIQRVYWLAIGAAALSLAHLFFPRKSTRGVLVDGRLTGAGWAVSIAVVSAAGAVIACLVITGIG